MINESVRKNILLALRYVGVFLITVVACYTFCGCSSTRNIDDENGRSAILTLGKLESLLDETSRRVADIERTANSLDGEIDYITRLFEEYTTAVRAMRAELDCYKRQTE